MDDVKQYPFMFPADQWSNKYSNFANKKLPFMGKMAANAPTDAYGRPIQSYLDAQKAHDAWQPTPAAPVQAPMGTRIDSNGNANAPGSNLNPMGDWSALAPVLPGASQQQQADYARNLGLGGFTDPSTGHAYIGGGGAGASSQQAKPAAQTNPIDMSAEYIKALANPGHVDTPGATVAQAPLPSQDNSVLQQFLANWNGNTRGAGNYDNSGFINALRGSMGGGAQQSAGGLANTPFTNYGDMGGADMGSLPGATPPPGTPGAPKDIAVRGYLDANGRPTQALGALMQPALQAQKNVLRGM